MMHLERSAGFIVKKVSAESKRKELPPVLIHKDRMDRALAEPRKSIPAGMTAEEVRAFILGVPSTCK